MGLGPQLVVETTRIGSHDVVVVSGEIDLASAAKVEAAIEGFSAQSVVLDLRKVEFMDSMGIGVLVRTSKKLGEEARAMSIVCAAGQVRRVLTVSGLDAMIPVFADLDAAADA